MTVTKYKINVNGACDKTENPLPPELAGKSKREATLEEALDIIGVGWYNLCICLLLTWFVVAAILEMTSYANILPGARCDLRANPSQLAWVTSIPNIVVIFTAHIWGYLADAYGRKPVLQGASLACGLFGALAAFMPDLTTFALCKVAGSLFVSCPSSLCFAYIVEIVPAHQRDFLQVVLNSLQTAGSIISALLPLAIYSLDFRIDFGLYFFRPWRLLTIMYSSTLLLAVVLMISGPESPKYLMTKGRSDEALAVLKTIYARNKWADSDDFPVSSLKATDTEQQMSKNGGFFKSFKTQTMPIFRPRYLKWLVLHGFLMFGVFSLLNGLLMWAPDVINAVLLDTSNTNASACDIIMENRNNVDLLEDCTDEINTTTFIFSSAGIAVCSAISLALSSSVNLIGKRAVLIISYIMNGMFAIGINLVSNLLVACAFFILLTLSSTGIGPINAFAVQIFPTEMRGMAIGLIMMCGRVGSVFGTVVGGALLTVTCQLTFYFFGSLTLFCALLCILLPRQ